MLSLSPIKVERSSTNKHPGLSWSTNEDNAGPKAQVCCFSLYQNHFIPNNTPFVSIPLCCAWTLAETAVKHWWEHFSSQSSFPNTCLPSTPNALKISFQLEKTKKRQTDIQASRKNWQNCHFFAGLSWSLDMKTWYLHFWGKCGKISSNCSGHTTIYQCRDSLLQPSMGLSQAEEWKRTRRVHRSWLSHQMLYLARHVLLCTQSSTKHSWT